MSTSWNSGSPQYYDKDGLPTDPPPSDYGLSGYTPAPGYVPSSGYTPSTGYTPPTVPSGYVPPVNLQQGYVPPVNLQQGAAQQSGYGQVQPYGTNAIVPAGYRPKSKVVAALLFFFLGGFGVGNFYLGQKNQGFAKLGLLVMGVLTSFVLIGIPILMALWLWTIIEMIMVLAGSDGYDVDGNGVPLI